MKQLKQYTMIGAIFVLIAGTLSHFLYAWTKNNFIIGLFTPINESIWEHMKLIFFPMLVYSCFMIHKLKEKYPCITASLFFGILLGTLLIPIFFYTYTGIFQQDIFFLDLAIFVFSVIIAFLTGYKLTLSCRMQKHTFLLRCLICFFIICFILFTYYPPNVGLFAEPAVSTAIRFREFLGILCKIKYRQLISIREPF